MYGEGGGEVKHGSMHRADAHSLKTHFEARWTADSEMPRGGEAGVGTRPASRRATADAAAVTRAAARGGAAAEAEVGGEGAEPKDDAPAGDGSVAERQSVPAHTSVAAGTTATAVRARDYLRVLLFVPNLIDYARLLCLAYSMAWATKIRRPRHRHACV